MACPRWVLTRIPSLLLLLGLTACMQAVVIESSIKPEVHEIAQYDYPYEGLRVALDPKGYHELAYEIVPAVGYNEHLGARKAEWMPLTGNLNFEFTPSTYRDWVINFAFRHPDGQVALSSKRFKVGLPPWHVDATPVEFAVTAGFACLHSEDLPHMVNVKTLIGYKLELEELPPEVDRSIYAGFSATAPSIRHAFGGREQIVPGRGGGAIPSFDLWLWFAGNYQLSGVDPYPHCEALEKTLAVADWSTSRIRLLDKFGFPMERTVGRVLRSQRVPREELAPGERITTEPSPTPRT